MDHLSIPPLVFFSRAEGPLASARKIDGYYLPHDEDDDSDLDDELDHLSGSEPMQRQHSKSIDIVMVGQTDQQVSGRAAFEARQLIVNFCSRTAITRVAPTERELEQLWEGINALSRNLADIGKAEVCESIVRSLYEQLSGELDGHEWKPQLRALCVLQFYCCKGGLDRHIAEAVINDSFELLQHLTTEVNPCREQALKVMRLRDLAAEVPGGEEIAVGSDGDIFVLKAANDQVPDEDQDTVAGSCSPVEASDSQDEQFVTLWPSSSQASGSPALVPLSTVSHTLAPAIGQSTDVDCDCMVDLLGLALPISAPESDARLSEAAERPTLDAPQVEDLTVKSPPEVSERSAREAKQIISLDDILDEYIALESLSLPSKLECHFSASPLPKVSSPNRESLSSCKERPSQRKTMPFIPWGIEDTLEVPKDPFAQLISL